MMVCYVQSSNEIIWFLFTSGTCTLKSCVFWLQVPVHCIHMIYLDLGTCTLKSYDISCLQVRVYWYRICFDFRYLYTEIIYEILTSGACTLKSYILTSGACTLKSYIVTPGTCTLKSCILTSGTCTLKAYDISWLQVPVHWNYMICFDLGTYTLKWYDVFWLQVPVHWNPMICSDFRYLYTLEDEGVTQPDQTFEVGTSHISSMESRREQGRGVVLIKRWKMWGDGGERRKGVITFWWGWVGGGEELECKVGQQKFLRHLESTLKLCDTRKENLFEAKPEFSKHRPRTLINGHGG